MYITFQKVIQRPLFSRMDVRLKIPKVSDKFKVLIVRNIKNTDNGYVTFTYTLIPLALMEWTEQRNI